MWMMENPKYAIGHLRVKPRAIINQQMDLYIIYINI